MYSGLWETMVWCLTLMPTTLRFSASALLRRLMLCRLQCQTAWTLWHPEWQPTGCSWTTVRQMHFGVRLHVVNIRSRPDPFELEASQSNRLSSFGAKICQILLKSKKLFVDVRMDGWTFETHCIRSTQRSRPKKLLTTNKQQQLLSNNHNQHHNKYISGSDVYPHMPILRPHVRYIANVFK